jgi:hypothetical protein
LERLAIEEHHSLLAMTMSDEEKSVMSLTPADTKVFFVTSPTKKYLRMLIVSQFEVILELKTSAKD